MAKSFVALTTLLCLAWPAAARAEPSTLDYRRIHAALQRSVAPARFTVDRASVSALRPGPVQPADSTRDSVWNGAWIGAGIGGVGGYIWARNMCGSNDEECSLRAGPAGVLGGIAMGAAVGAIIDALR